MELILIGDSKLKIMLSQKDMVKYALRIEDIDYDNTETRRAFWNILDEAKHRTGFDAASAKVCIQVFPCRLGGCEIFVTKIENTEKDSLLSLEVKDSQNKSCEIYKFSTLQDLLSVCKALKNKEYDGESSVYFNSKHYFLILNKAAGTEFIKEYAEKQNNKNYIYHIFEHCEKLCINKAVSLLAPLS